MITLCDKLIKIISFICIGIPFIVIAGILGFIISYWQYIIYIVFNFALITAIINGEDISPFDCDDFVCGCFLYLIYVIDVIATLYGLKMIFKKLCK